MEILIVMENQEQSFARASEQAVNKELRSGLWLVYEDYTCDYSYDRFGALGDRYLYAPPHSRGKDGVLVENTAADKLAPLHVPALFLEFAGLAEEMDTPGLSLRPERLEGVLALPEGLNTGRNAA